MKKRFELYAKIGRPKAGRASMVVDDKEKIVTYRAHKSRIAYIIGIDLQADIIVERLIKTEMRMNGKDVRKAKLHRG